MLLTIQNIWLGANKMTGDIERPWDYSPDNWIILEITQDGKTYHKVLSGWSGGYLHGDHWRMNSGIKSIDEVEGYYYIHGYSGSIYKCNKESEMIRMNISGIFKQLQDFVKEVKISTILDKYITTS